ncbi:MAG: hypothetical protein H6821_10640 [Planctomycetaceae bacterium]|nr:hypothetical protein [Planctomycetales bacterium]MCB9874623.1 hypothetical protein [Planctomycetaceae bacterium]MCB9936953.1 hypothetical protein [Planctomycetaceae bacterium]HRX80199.1 hypothetical protein [Pirellulaceae bacterium]
MKTAHRGTWIASVIDPSVVTTVVVSTEAQEKKADEVEIFEIILAIGMLAAIFAVAGFCELIGER